MKVGGGMDVTQWQTGKLAATAQMLWGAGAPPSQLLLSEGRGEV